MIYLLLGHQFLGGESAYGQPDRASKSGPSPTLGKPDTIRVCAQVRSSNEKRWLSE